MPGLRECILAFGLLLSPALGDYTQTCKGDNICIDSFMWCAQPPENSSQVISLPIMCTPPSYADPNKHSGDRSTITIRAPHTIHWRNADSKYPILLKWIIYDAEDFNGTVLWSRNITNGGDTFGFQIKALIEDVATDKANQTYKAIMGRVLQASSNYIEASQPERPKSKDETGPLSTRTEVFQVINDYLPYFISSQADWEVSKARKKWVKIVALCLGLGGPAIAAAAFCGGMFLGKRRASRQNKAMHKPLPCADEDD